MRNEQVSESNKSVTGTRGATAGQSDSTERDAVRYLGIVMNTVLAQKRTINSTSNAGAETRVRASLLSGCRYKFFKSGVRSPEENQKKKSIEHPLMFHCE